MISMTSTYVRRLRRAGALAAALAVLAGCGKGAVSPSGQAPKPAAVVPGIRWDSNQPPDQQAQLAAQTGSLAFRLATGEAAPPALSAKSLPASTAKVTLILASSALGVPFSVDILPSQFANGAVLFTVYSLAAGQYTVSAAVKDSSNAILAAGSTPATVVAGTTSPVTLLLSTNANNTTGGVQVSIDTTSSNAAAAAVTLPSSGTVKQTVTLPAGSSPAGITIDSSGNLWVARNGAGKVTKVDLGTSPATLTDYTVGTNPIALAIDGSGNVWVTNNGSASIHKISSSGTVSGPYTVNSGPAGIAIDGSGNVWVANNGTFTAGTGGSGTTVQKLNSSGSLLNTYTGFPAGPWGIAIDTSGNAWVGTTTGVSKRTSSTLTNYSVDLTQGKHLQSGLAISSDGSIWTANDATSTATQMASDGTVKGYFAVGAAPWGIAIDGYKAIWVANATGNSVSKLDSTGTVLGTFALTAGTTPWGIALDARGNAWITGHGNNTLVELGR